MDRLPVAVSYTHLDVYKRQYVDRERRLELAFEGIRWHDLVRHNNLQAIRDMYIRYASDEDARKEQSQSRNTRDGKGAY